MTGDGQWSKELQNSRPRNGRWWSIAEASATGHYTTFTMDLGEDVVFCVSGDDKFLLDLSWRQLGALWLEPELLRRLVSSFLPLPLKAAEAKTQMTFRTWSFSLRDETQWRGEETSPIRVASTS